MTITHDHEVSMDLIDELGLEPDEISEAADARERVEASPVTPDKYRLSMDNSALLTRGIRKRRSCPIIGYVGLNGQGKTMAMVRDMLPSLAMGRRVLSTVTILDPMTGLPHPNFELLRSWSQFVDFTDGDILLDEITGIMDSRDQGMPKHVRRLLPQMRRRNVRVSWTGIDFDNSDRRLRQLSQAIVKCKGTLPNTSAIRNSGQKDIVPMWAPNRVFFLNTFDAQTLTSSEDSRMLTEQPAKRRRARILSRETVWGPSSLAFRAYNTLDAVSGVDNSCVVCGGKPMERSCRGHD